MKLVNIVSNGLLSAVLSASPLDASTLRDTVKVDLTGDDRKEVIVYDRTYTDSSSCRVFKFKGEEYPVHVKVWEKKFRLGEGDYRLFVGDYNGDGVKDFTVELPNRSVDYFVRWDKKKEKFVLVDSLSEESRLDSLVEEVEE